MRKSYQNQVQEYLEKNHADATVGDVLGTSKIKEYKSNMLSPVLPYRVKTVISDYQELPKDMRHYFKFNLYENIGFLGQSTYGLPLYEYEIATTKLQGKPLSFSFRPENEAEQQKLLKTMTDDGMPINVWVKPELRLGDEILEDEGRYRLGYDIKIRYGIESPNSGVPTFVKKDIRAGEYHAIGYNLQGMSQQQLKQSKKTLENAKKVLESGDNKQLDTLSKHDTMGAMLQATVQSYFAINEQQDKLLASQSNIVQNYHLSFGTVSSNLTTDYTFGLPWRTRSTGVMVDIDRLRHQVVSKSNKAEEQIKFLQLQGVRESSNENLIPEKLFEDTDGISAVKALQTATDEGQTIYRISKDNQYQVLPKLNAHSARTLQEVNNALNAGLQVTISEKPIKLNGWKGAGYIITDLKKGTGAYMIEGVVNGTTLQKICGKKMRSAVKGLLKPKIIARGVAGAVAISLVSSFIINLANSVAELSECHKKLITGVLSALDAVILAYDAMSFLRVSGIGGILLASSVPLMMYPVVAMATMELQQCNASTRAISSYSVRSFDISSYAKKKPKKCDSCKGKKKNKGSKKNECDPCKKKKTRSYANEKITVECLLKKIKKTNGLGITSELYQWVSKLNDKRDTVLVQKINNLGSKFNSKYWKRLNDDLKSRPNGNKLKSLFKKTPNKLDTWKYVARLKTSDKSNKSKLTQDVISLGVIHR